MSKIFTGMIFIFINFHINVGAVRVGLIPNFIGLSLLLMISKNEVVIRTSSFFHVPYRLLTDWPY